MKKILSSSSCKILVILALLLLGSSLAKAQSFSVDYNAVKLSYALSDIQKKSYSTLLSDILKKSPENDAAFELCDLDGNNLPELILSTGVAEDSDCKIYYLSDAAVSDLGNGCGRNGFISFDLKSKTFFSDNNGDIQCWSMTSSDLSKFSKSESCMDCGRKYLLTADGIESAFL